MKIGCADVCNTTLRSVFADLHPLTEAYRGAVQNKCGQNVGSFFAVISAVVQRF